MSSPPVLPTPDTRRLASTALICKSSFVILCHQNCNGSCQKWQQFLLAISWQMPVYQIKACTSRGDNAGVSDSNYRPPPPPNFSLEVGKAYCLKPRTLTLPTHFTFDTICLYINIFCTTPITTNCLYMQVCSLRTTTISEQSNYQMEASQR